MPDFIVTTTPWGLVARDPRERIDLDGAAASAVAQPSAAEHVEQIAQDYCQQHGHDPFIFIGSSPGAAQFGVVRLEPTHE